MHFYDTTFTLFCQGFITKILKGCDDISDFIKFRAEVKKELALREWKYKDLAKATGYSVNAIDTFMCGARCSETLRKKIAEVLNISTV